MKSSQSMVFEWFSEAISSSPLAQRRGCDETESTLPAGGLCKRTVPILAYILYMYCIYVRVCMTKKEKESARVRNCGVRGSTLAPSQCVQTQRLRARRGQKWHEEGGAITSSYLQHFHRQAVIQPWCHCVNVQAFNRIYTFASCAKKEKRKKKISGRVQ